MAGMSFPSRIRDGLYIGGIDTIDQPAVVECRITCVLSLLSGPATGYVQLGRLSHSIEHLYVDIDDAPHASLLETLPRSLKFVRKHNASPACNVLVHCLAGESRSVATVVAFMLASPPFPDLDVAMREMVEAHPRAAPNNSFVRQLRVFEAFVKDQSLLPGLQPSTISSWHFPKFPVEMLYSMSEPARVGILSELLHMVAAVRHSLNESNAGSYSLVAIAQSFAIPAQQGTVKSDCHYGRCRSCRLPLVTCCHVLKGNVLEDNLVHTAPLVWMISSIESSLYGPGCKVSRKPTKLRCPNCESKVGSFGWGEGVALIRGQTYDLPYFAINKSAIDWMRV